MAPQAVHLLYHGTVRNYANQIWTKGIDLSCQRPKTDFGTGFYTTTQWEQAVVWAREASRKYTKKHGYSSPAIIVFSVDPAQWKALSGLSFMAWPAPDMFGVRFVASCRASTNLTHAFDYVYGPVYRRPFKKPRPIRGRDQLSVHNVTTASILDAGKVGVWEEKGVMNAWTRMIP